MSELEFEQQYDPFGKDVNQAILITNMKIYDVLMALLMEKNEDLAKELDRLHTSGIVLGMGPNFANFALRDDFVSQSDDIDTAESLPEE